MMGGHNAMTENRSNLSFLLLARILWRANPVVEITYQRDVDAVYLVFVDAPSASEINLGCKVSLGFDVTDASAQPHLTSACVLHPDQVDGADLALVRSAVGKHTWSTAVTMLDEGDGPIRVSLSDAEVRAMRKSWSRLLLNHATPPVETQLPTPAVGSAIANWPANPNPGKGHAKPIASTGGDRRAPVSYQPARRQLLAMTVLTLIATAGLVIISLSSSLPMAYMWTPNSSTLMGDPGLEIPPPTNPPRQLPFEQMLTVYNKVTDGANQMRERTPAYLSTKPRNNCRNAGCIIPGIELGTGATVTSFCQVRGAQTTNGRVQDPSDDRNPELFTSDLWYGIRWSDGRIGYISEVWIWPDDRGGLGLSEC
jgi:hypothetical protein